MGRNSGGASRRPSGSAGSSPGGSSGGRISGGRTTQKPGGGSGAVHSQPARGAAHSGGFRAAPPSPPPPPNRRPPRYHSGYRDYPPPPPPPRHGHYHGGGYRSGGHCSGGRRSSPGCFVSLLAGLMVIFILIGLLNMYVNKAKEPSQPVQNSLNQPAPAPSSAQQQTVSPPAEKRSSEYYTDTLGWITQEDILHDGMKEFQEKTGVLPYVYITDNVNGDGQPTDAKLDLFANGLYDQLFTDENHFLLVFLESGEFYMTRYVCGSEAAETVNAESADIVLDCVDEYYSNSDLGDDEFFSTVFSEAAKKITEQK